MSDNASSQHDNAQTVDFLRRLANLLSGGLHAGRLLDAAALIEALTDRTAAAEQAWREQRDECLRNIESRKAAETTLRELTSGVITLNAELDDSAQQSDFHRTLFAEEKKRLLARAEKAEAQLASATAELGALRASLDALGDSMVVVSIQSLQAARAQFDSLAAKFAANGDVISRTICEIGGCTIDQAMTNGKPAAQWR